MKLQNRVLAAILCALVIFGAMGCNTSNPVDVSNTGRAPVVRSGNILGSLLGLVSPLLLPSGNGKGKIVSVQQNCSPNGTTSMSLSYTYGGLLGLPVTRTATFTVPAGALNNTTSITMSFDTTSAMVHFEPEGLVFNTPCKLDFSIGGLGNLLNLSGVGFYYVDNNGVGTPMLTQSLIVNPLFGTVTMKGGSVPHFSGYAFAR
ncbi:MAG TPA: hypothetical protein VKS81_00875 [Bacteroidota bacterium]|nr:hypothetical protein [Bacteroidota bacterium]